MRNAHQVRYVNKEEKLHSSLYIGPPLRGIKYGKGCEEQAFVVHTVYSINTQKVTTIEQFQRV